jgi:hypothetical protein
MKNVLKYIPLGLFSALAIKFIIQGGQFQDALALLVVGGLIAFLEYKLQDEKMNEINNQLKSHAEQIEKMKKEGEELRGFVSAAQLGKQYKIGR